ncbi:MAG: hypothetical protein KGL39_12840 [Patescibacteria group bacterium]|nr:hypothetical protein [Patescibacteria group bacterium]
MTKTMIAQAREWVEDCAADDDDLEARQEASDEEILRYVRAFYDGGLSAFIATCDLQDAIDGVPA